MTRSRGPRVHERWAHLRFCVIGQLLAAPPAKGELRAAIASLAARQWRHPGTGELVSFGFSTIERWYSAERIVLRSGRRTRLKTLCRSIRYRPREGALALHNVECSLHGADPRRLKEGEPLCCRQCLPIRAGYRR